MTAPDQLIPTRAIDSLVTPAGLAEARASWRSFVPFQEATISRKAAPALLCNAGVHGPALAAEHEAVAPVRELGLYYVRDVTVSGHFYPFVDGAFLDDGSTPSRIGLQFARDERQDLGTLINRSRQITVDRPILVIGGPGYPIWGHWLLDFLPRLAIARQMLGAELQDFAIPIPSDTPGWVRRLMHFFCGVGEERLVPYDRGEESVFAARACLPTMAHSNYFLHPYVRSFYQSFWPQDAPTQRRICVSRRSFGQTRNSVVRTFAEEAYFEDTAQRRGFEIVFPETLDFRGQIDLFFNASDIVGQYGSAMHSALFSRSGTLVAQFCMPNTIQSRIAGLCEHRSAYLFPDADVFDAEGIKRLSVSHGAIDDFFASLSALG